MSLFNVSEHEERTFTAADIAKYSTYSTEEPLRPATISTLTYRYRRSRDWEAEFLKSVGESGPKRTKRYTLRQLLAFSVYSMLSHAGVSQEEALFFANMVFKERWKRRRREYDFVGLINELGASLAVLRVELLGTRLGGHHLIEFNDETQIERQIYPTIKKLRDSWLSGAAAIMRKDKRFSPLDRAPSARIYIVSAAVKESLARLEEA